MFLWLVQYFGPLLQQLESRTTGDSRVYLTARTAAASVSAFVLALVLDLIAIRWLQERFPERVHSDSAGLNELHAAKNDTPTMGGLFVMTAVLISTLIWADLTSRYVLTALLVTMSLAGIGALDDWIKLTTRRKGLTVR